MDILHFSLIRFQRIILRIFFRGVSNGHLRFTSRGSDATAVFDREDAPSMSELRAIELFRFRVWD